jgi:hypothetical protein
MEDKEHVSDDERLPSAVESTSPSAVEPASMSALPSAVEPASPSVVPQSPWKRLVEEWRGDRLIKVTGGTA